MMQGRIPVIYRCTASAARGETGKPAGNRMTFIRSFGISVICVITGIALCCCLPAAAQVQTYIGDVVPLSGYSYGGPYVYLFLTGPNLPVNGVPIDNINLRADQGQFTRVDVNSDGHWEFKWGTNNVGGKLDAGVYTIYVVDGPNDRSQLAFADYSTISVDLTKPYISAGVNSPAGQGQVQPGTMDITTVPPDASITIDNAYRGLSPLTVDGLSPGVHNLSLSKFGYEKLVTPVTIESASISEVRATLALQTGSIAVNTSPAGANITLDGTAAGISPRTIGNITPGNHTLTLTVSGFDTRTLGVQVLPDQTTIANLEFATPPTPLPAAPYPTRAAGLVPAVLAAMVVCGMLAARKKQ